MPMRLERVAVVVVVTVFGCGDPAAISPPAQTRQAIAYGTLDTTHDAVVAVLGDAGGGSFTECSGGLVQVKNGIGYVLTAAHCCNSSVPSLVVLSNDYSSSLQYLGSTSPQPPAYAVLGSSVYYDSQYNLQDRDFCMLKFNAPAGSAVIPVPAGADGLTTNASVEYVGFGVTDNN